LRAVSRRKLSGWGKRGPEGKKRCRKSLPHKKNGVMQGKTKGNSFALQEEKAPGEEKKISESEMDSPLKPQAGRKKTGKRGRSQGRGGERELKEDLRKNLEKENS